MKKLLISLIGGLFLMLLIVYVVKPLIIKHFFTMGANSQIKKDSRCEKYKEENIKLMTNKDNVSMILEKAKQDKCLKSNR